MIQGAIFDADGTLLDSMQIWKEAGARYLQQFGIELSDEAYKKMFTMSLEESAVFLKEHYGLQDSPDKIKRDVLKNIEDFYRFEVSAKPGVHSFLCKMKKENIPMAIATSGDRALLESALERLNIRHYFKEIFTCTELLTSKKEPFIYYEAAKHLGTQPQKTVVFEDVLYAIETAKKAGFITAAVSDTQSDGEAAQIRLQADYYIADFSDFQDFMKYASAH